MLSVVVLEPRWLHILDNVILHIPISLAIISVKLYPSHEFPFSNQLLQKN